jgi:hypothetical protein
MWHEAAVEFQRQISDPRNVFEYKLQPGECVVFDNLRVLHGRRAFDTSSGKRWLKGTYVDGQIFASAVLRAPDTVLAEFNRPQWREPTLEEQLAALYPEGSPFAPKELEE